MGEPVDDLAGHDLFETGESMGGLGVATALGIGERIVEHELRSAALQNDRLKMRRPQRCGRISDPVEDGKRTPIELVADDKDGHAAERAFDAVDEQRAVRVRRFEDRRDQNQAGNRIDFITRNRIESRCGAGVVGDDPDFRRHAVQLFGQRAQIVGVQLRRSKSGERYRRLVVEGDVRNDRGDAVVEIVPAGSDDEIIFAPADMSLAVEIDVAVAAGQQNDGVGRPIGLHQQDAHRRIGPGDPIVGDHRSRIERPAVEHSG